MALSSLNLFRPGLWHQYSPFYAMPIWLQKTKVFTNWSQVGQDLTPDSNLSNPS